MIGQTVSHYQIQQHIGEGGMGVVYKALDTRLDRPVALKFLSEEFSREAQALERFRQEARAASALNHPQICTIHDIGEHQGRPYIVMEFLEGRSLKERIALGPLKTDEVLEYALQIAGALEAAHGRGIVHRDIKPANIFITNIGTVKLLDFGLAKLAPREAGPHASTTMGSTKTGTVVGTVAYMSPEQARAEPVDARSDLFSLGVVIYEMATGRQAFSGPSIALVYDSILNREPPLPTTLNTSIPSQLDFAIQKAIEKDSSLRYQRSSELRQDLERLKRDWLTGRTTFLQARDITPPKAAPSPAPVTGGKSPKIAFLLGFIPGVGALYNEQYKKAAIHFLVFAILSGMGRGFDADFGAGGFAQGIDSFLSYLTFGFYAYVVFDSYDVAKSRRRAETARQT